MSDTSHFHIGLHGNYVPGLCDGPAIATDDIGGQPPSGKYPLLERPFPTGIAGLIHLARDDFGYSPRRSGYLNHCDLRTDIRASLRRLEGQNFTELAPDGFYA